MRDALLEWLGDTDALGGGRSRLWIALAIAGGALLVALSLGLVAFFTREPSAVATPAPAIAVTPSAPTAETVTAAVLAAPADLGIEACDEYGRLACACTRAELRADLCPSAHTTLADLRETLRGSGQAETRARVERSCAALRDAVRPNCAAP
jgi:hypothetical protein